MFDEFEIVLYNGTKATVVHVYKDDDGNKLGTYEIEFEDAITGKMKTITIDENDLETYKGVKS